jgi:hypothetical protein
MLNIRILVLSSILVLVLVLTVGLVTARTELISNASSNPADISAAQEQSANPKAMLSTSSYRAQFGECYDVPIRDLAACRGASQSLDQPERPPLDECFDVSISELASCRNGGQAPIP